MRVGIKLDIDFATSGVYRRLYGRRHIPGFLRDLGVDAIETPVGPETSDAAIREHARVCHGAGLRLSLHPYSEATRFNPAFFSPSDENPCCQLHERFFAIAAEAANLQQTETIVNIHPAAGSRELARDTLVDQSVRFFEWARGWCRANAAGAHPVVELQIRPNPEEPIQRIGDHYAELLDVMRRSGCDACWDFGHAYMNAKRFGLPLEPPTEFFRRVVHVHCHDANDEDHQPLIFGNVAWQRHLQQLMATGFDGTVVLEVPPQHFVAAGGLDDLRYSVHSLLGCVRAEANGERE